MLKFKLIPRDDGFFELFDHAAANLEQASILLADMLKTDSDKAGHLAQIVEAEHKGDELNRAINQKINTSFVTPFDREDIHALANELDDAVDDIRAAADMMVLHNVNDVITEASELGDRLVDGAKVATGLIEKLRRLKGLQEDIESIDAIESAADRTYHAAIKRLFSGEFDAFSVLRWKDVVTSIENAVDRIENIADIVATLQLKHS